MELNNFCRTCLSASEGMRSLYETCAISTQMCCAEMLSTVTPLICCKDDGLPTTICHNCIREVNRCHTFRLKCLESDEVARKHLKKVTGIATTNITVKTEQTESRSEDSIKVEVMDEDRIFEEVLIKNECPTIFDILNGTVIGKTLLSRFQNDDVDNNCRCKLAELIVTGEYGSDTNATIKGERFLELAQSIVSCFPNEIEETYYISSSIRGKGRAAAGKLYDTYVNINKGLRKQNLRVLKHSKKSTSSNYIMPEIEHISAIDYEQLQRQLEFLKTHLEPWEEVRACWENTVNIRQTQLRDGTNPPLKVSDYLKTYPIIKQPGGLLLLEYDFGVLFKEVDKNLAAKWPIFLQKLKEKLLQSGVKLENLDCETAILFNYPQLFNVISVKVPNSKPWRANRAELQEGFLVHIEDISDLEIALEGIRKTALSKGTELQPIPVIVGNALSEITSSFVVIDNRPIGVESPMRAVELTFKVYHSLFCKYPIQSARLWIVLSKALFNIEEEWHRDLETADVKRLVSALSC